MPDPEYPPPGAGAPNPGGDPDQPDRRGTDSTGAHDPTTPDSAPPPPGGWPAPGQPSDWSPPGSVPSRGAVPQQSFPQYPGSQHPGPQQQLAWRPGAVPVARPGAVPLRPLGLGDLVDGAVRIVRRNAGATVGAALLVSVLALLVPLVATAVTSSMADLSGWADPDADLDTTEAVLLGITLASWVLGTVLQVMATVIVAGMCAHVTAAAVLGRTLTLRQAWDATRGHRWRLVWGSVLLGLAMLLLVALYLVLVLVASLYGGWPAGITSGVLGGLALLAALSWLWIRVQLLATPVIALERRKVLDAFSRSSALTRGHFWRLFGIILLVTVVLQVIASMVSLPVTLLSALPALAGASPAASFFAQAAGQGASLVLTTALVTPFTATLGALVLTDLRMRKEAFDVELLQHVPAPGA